MSPVTQTSRVVMRSAIQSSAASAPSATVTIETSGLREGKIGREPFGDDEDLQPQALSHAIDLVPHGAGIGVDVDGGFPRLGHAAEMNSLCLRRPSQRLRRRRPKLLSERMLNPYPPAWFAATRFEQRQQTARARRQCRRGGRVVVGFGFQLVRLHQDDPVGWLAADYAMRIAVLLILAAPPALRRMVYAQEWRDAHIVETVFWTLTVALFLWVTDGFWNALMALLPIPRLGGYPELHGLLRLFDLTFGLALVATEEELLWRRAMRIALIGLGDGRRMIALSAVLFGAYHWWRGGQTIMAAAVFGALAIAALPTNRRDLAGDRAALFRGSGGLGLIGGGIAQAVQDSGDAGREQLHVAFHLGEGGTHRLGLILGRGARLHHLGDVAADAGGLVADHRMLALISPVAAACCSTAAETAAVPSWIARTDSTTSRTAVTATPVICSISAM